MNPVLNPFPYSSSVIYANRDTVNHNGSQRVNPPVSRLVAAGNIQQSYNNSVKPTQKRDAATAGVDLSDYVPKKIWSGEPPGAGARGPEIIYPLRSANDGDVKLQFGPFYETIVSLRRDVEDLQQDTQGGGTTDVPAAPLHILPHFNRLMDVLSRYIEMLRNFNTFSQSAEIRASLYENLSELGPIINRMIQVINYID